MTSRSIVILGLTALFFIVACETAHIYFPAAGVQKAADQIVGDVRGKKKGEEPKTTPPIRSLKESLKNRFPSLKPFYNSGRIGENSQGFVSVQDLQGLGLKEKAELNPLMEEENRDRNTLYKEILRANKFGPEHGEEVERIFANSWRNNASKGWWIQTDEGEWVRKP